jgi:hypothetical protein
MKLITKNFKGVYMKKMTVILMTILFGQIVNAVSVSNNADALVGNFAEVKCGYGLDCAQVSGKLLIKPSVGSGAVFASGDATPSVSGAGPLFKTFPAYAGTVTGFTNAYSGQEFIVISQGAVTLDVTSSNIVCGSTDIVTASGDLTRFVYDGAVSRCAGFVDLSDNLN